MTVGPVRALRLPVTRRCAPREASRLSLDAPPRCFESASTTDVCSRAPAAKTPSLETSRRAPWRKPRRRSASRSSSSVASPPPFAEDAGPPRGHPASNGSVLDGTSPASGRQAVAHALSRRAEGAQQLFRLLHASPVEPSDASTAIEKEERVSAPVSQRYSRYHELHVNAARLREFEAPSAGEVRSARPRGHPPGALHPLADGRRCCTCSSMFENLD